LIRSLGGAAAASTKAGKGAKQRRRSVDVTGVIADAVKHAVRDCR
jgi:hypothetical protein